MRNGIYLALTKASNTMKLQLMYKLIIKIASAINNLSSPSRYFGKVMASINEESFLLLFHKYTGVSVVHDHAPQRVRHKMSM